MVNLFSFGCHVVDRVYVRTIRTYVRVSRLYGWGKGDYQKEERGVSGVSWQIFLHFLYWTFTIRSIDSCQNRIATDQYHEPISRAHLWTHWGDVIYFEAVRWPVNCFTRCSISYFLASLGAQENWQCTNIRHQCCNQLTTVKTGYPLTSITWPYRELRCRPIEVKYFLTLSADKLLVLRWSQAQV